MSVSQFAQPLLAIGTAAGALSAGGAMILLAGLWLPFGPGARRRRAFVRAQRHFQQGAWQEAIALVKEQQEAGRLTPAWEGRLRNLEGECHRLAGEIAVREQRFEEGLEQLLTSAGLLGLNQQEARAGVIDAMLDNVRRLYSSAAPADLNAAVALAERVLALQASCAEASFWQGLCYVRQERADLAVAALREAHGTEADGFFDPSFYLGAYLLRQGSAQEAMRFLSEANRLAPACPFATWQLGVAILAADGDSQVAVRALQKARERLATLRKHENSPQRLWLDVLPESKSYVRRLALKYPYSCPLLGSSLAAMLREVQLGLGQATCRQGNFQEAVRHYMTVLHESPPTAPVLRGLGQALARLERYEEAYNHLRAAYDQEDPKDPLTAGYLALCGARGKPTEPGDRIKNVEWALGLLAEFDLRGNAEWAGLCNAIHAEARAVDQAISPDDQVRLCEALASVEATDSQAALAYEHLASTFPERVRREYAWLYCRAAQQHRCGGKHELDLFGRTFAEEAAARAFYADRGWDFEEMEYTYLERWAARNPGRFPEISIPNYAARAQSLLLARSRREEQAGDEIAAQTSAEVLLTLAPHSLPALDRLAQLCFCRGDRNRSTDLLADWHALDPADPLPLVRQAVIEQNRGNREGCTRAIELALERTQHQERAAIAFLGARLLVADLVSNRAASAGQGSGQTPAPGASYSADHPQPSPDWQTAIQSLTECLKEDPNHKEALWLHAAIHALLGDRQSLAAQSALMRQPASADARLQFMAACCHLAAGDTTRALEACALTQKLDASLSAETSYLRGLAQAQSGDCFAAVKELETVAQAPESPSFDHAKALLGQFNFANGHYDDAIKYWQSLDSPRRAAWRLDEPLRATVFLSALLALEAGDFAQAASRLREAGRLGCRDRRLGGLLMLALMQEGKRLLREAGSGSNGAAGESSRENLESAVRVFEQALNAGARQPEVAYLLALAYKRQGKLREARAAFHKIAQPDADVLLQLGVLSLREGHLEQAEQEFSTAWETNSQSYAIGFNLLMTRLALGRIDASTDLLARLGELAADVENRRLLTLLQALLRCSQNGDKLAEGCLAGMSAGDEQRLLALLRGVGDPDTLCLLLETLARIPAASGAAQDARFEAILVKGKSMLERCDWGGAERVLVSLKEETSVPEKRAALLNLLGCCSCLGQDFQKGAKYFEAALRLGEADACVQQNLALVHEWQGKHAEAEPYWNGYFENVEAHLRPPPGATDYGARLAFEGYSRLATVYADKERWAPALAYAKQAHRLRPNDADILEKLFHLYTQSGRADEARRVLSQLRKVRPGDGQFELYELDLMNVRNLDSIEKMIGNIEKVLKRNPDDARVEVRATVMVGNVLPVFERVFKQSSDQMAKVTNQVRYLPKYQIDWSAVREVARELRQEFQRLRRLGNRCFALIKDDEQRRTISELSARIERKLEQCRSLSGG